MPVIARSTDTSVAQTCLAFADADGRKTALAAPEGTWNRHELAYAIELLAAHIRRETSSDETIIVLMDNNRWSVGAVLACELTGRTSALLRATTTNKQITQAAERSSASLVLRTRDVNGTGEPGCTVIPGTPVTWNRIGPGRGPRLPHDTAFIGGICQQSSGSTAAPKFAVRSHAAIMTEVLELSGALSLSDTDVVLCGSSISHSYGLMGGLLAPLFAGACVLLARDALAVSRLVPSYSPTIMFSLGSVYAELLDVLSPAAPGLRRVRLAFSAGASLPSGLFERVRDRLGLQVRQDYGTTETGTISLDLAPTADPNSVGRSLPHLEVVLRVPAAANLRGAEIGEILVRGSAVATGYRAGPKLLPCVDADGWFNTHDAGSLYGGQLRVHRRIRVPVKVHGGLVDLDAVEAAITSMPGVREVIAHVRHVRSGLLLCVLVAIEGRTAEEVRDWCREFLPPASVPDEIEVVEALPRSPAGKVLLRYI